MAEDVKTVIHTSTQPVKIILQRVPAGKYFWEVHASGASVSEILPIIREADKKLRNEYGGA